MAWLSLLPSNLSVIESWIKSFFIFLALLTIGPWALVFLYDLLLYLYRAIYHEIPIIGGRAQGRARPRAPTLTERPSGDPRHLGLTKIGSLGEDGVTGSSVGEDQADNLRQRRHADSTGSRNE